MNDKDKHLFIYWKNGNLHASITGGVSGVFPRNLYPSRVAMMAHAFQWARDHGAKTFELNRGED